MIDQDLTTDPDDTPSETPEQWRQRHCLTRLADARRAAEAEGVLINGIRYAGDAGSRQALSEALQAADGTATFAAWKDSDGQFHAEHPVSEVSQAQTAIAQRRAALIAQEADVAAAIRRGEGVSIDAVVWVVGA